MLGWTIGYSKFNNSYTLYISVIFSVCLLMTTYFSIWNTQSDSITRNCRLYWVLRIKWTTFTKTLYLNKCRNKKLDCGANYANQLPTTFSWQGMLHIMTKTLMETNVLHWKYIVLQLHIHFALAILVLNEELPRLSHIL